MKRKERIRRALALIMVMAVTLAFAGCGNSRSGKTGGASEKAATTEGKTGADASTDQSGTGENMIDKASATFDDGTGAWNSYTNGGSATLGTDDHRLAIDIKSTGDLDYGVQAYLDGFALDQGCRYKFSFDVSSTVDRTVEWRIQINGGDYHAYVSDQIKLTKDVQHVEKEFEMTEASDPAPRLCLNCGKFEGDNAAMEHTIYCDNFSLTLADASGKTRETNAVQVPDVNLDQVGYTPDMKKTAVVRGDGSGNAAFDVINADTGETVLSGTTGDSKDNAASGETAAVADFSELKDAGRYKIRVDGVDESDEFTVGDDVYSDITASAVRMFYMQRCGTAIPESEGGEFAHKACHTGEAVIYGTDKKKDVTGGWHDAGDYGRYVVAGAKAAQDLMLAYELNPSYWGDNADIPESGNGIPDILDEVRYELDWMLKMQDEDSGGVYHKVTCKNFPETVMPEDETDTLYLSPISQTATGDFAAVMARASQVYKKIDPEFSKKALAAAEKAIKYNLSQKPDAGFTNPSDIVTGEYGDRNSIDETFWGLAELYRATGSDSYQKEMKKLKTLSISTGLGWASVGCYGIYAYLTCDSVDQDYAKELVKLWNNLVKKTDENASGDIYNASCGENYPWGSNMTMANNGMLALMSEQLQGRVPGAEVAQFSTDYRDFAASQLHYLLGENANGYCFVTGFGTTSPKTPHHRPSQAKSEAVPGMLVGGPDNGLEDPYAKATLSGVPAAKCYADNAQAYSLNEITIYWNSPLVYLLSGLQRK